MHFHSTYNASNQDRLPAGGFPACTASWWASSKAALNWFWRGVVNQGVFTRYTDFSKGVISTASIVFFIAATVVFLFVTVKVLESRRWK